MNATLTPCPGNGRLGKVVKLTTLKALLTPQALKRLEPVDTYHSGCPMDVPWLYAKIAETIVSARFQNT